MIQCRFSRWICCWICCCNPVRDVQMYPETCELCEYKFLHKLFWYVWHWKTFYAKYWCSFGSIFVFCVCNNFVFVPVCCDGFFVWHFSVLSFWHMYLFFANSLNLRVNVVLMCLYVYHKVIYHCCEFKCSIYETTAFCICFVIQFKIRSKIFHEIFISGTANRNSFDDTYDSVQFFYFKDINLTNLVHPLVMI